jgi:hypothetical protein
MMAVFLGAFPVLPGKSDDARKFARETMDRRDEFTESQQKSGITKEEWSLQETPMGALVLVRFEAPDIEKSFARLAESTDDFDVWFRGRVQELTGIDLAAPSDDPPPEVILDWTP